MAKVWGDKGFTSAFASVQDHRVAPGKECGLALLQEVTRPPWKREPMGLNSPNQTIGSKKQPLFDDPQVLPAPGTAPLG
jgi:hypothetical protein